MIRRIPNRRRLACLSAIVALLPTSAFAFALDGAVTEGAGLGDYLKLDPSEALIVGADMTFVVAHHLLRIFFVILGAPVLAMLIPTRLRD